jgi:hypothetical protein
MQNDMAQFEDIQERILEALQTDSSVCNYVNAEVRERWPNFDELPKETQDECVCVVQLLVYRRILNAIAE